MLLQYKPIEYGTNKGKLAIHLLEIEDEKELSKVSEEIIKKFKETKCKSKLLVIDTEDNDFDIYRAKDVAELKTELSKVGILVIGYIDGHEYFDKMFLFDYIVCFIVGSEWNHMYVNELIYWTTFADTIEEPFLADNNKRANVHLYIKTSTQHNEDEVMKFIENATYPWGIIC